MEEIRSREEITAKMLELEKELGYRYASGTKDLIRTKISSLKWVLKKRDRL